MTINEIAKELNITKRAMKYYEEQGLLKVFSVMRIDLKMINAHFCYM